MAAAFRSIVSALRNHLARRRRLHRLVTVAAMMLALLVAAGGTRADAQEVIEYYATDAVGSIRVVFAPDGTVKARSDYLPFGEEWQPATPGGPLPPQRFTGQQRDAEENLDYFKARSVQDRLGRFTTTDRIFNGQFNPQGWNRYAYALNSPSTFVDPDGLNPESPGQGGGTPGHGDGGGDGGLGGCQTPPCDGPGPGPPPPGGGPVTPPKPGGPTEPTGPTGPVGPIGPAGPAGPPGPTCPVGQSCSPPRPTNPVDRAIPPKKPCTRHRVEGNLGWIEVQQVPYGMGYADNKSGADASGRVHWGVGMHNPAYNHGSWTVIETVNYVMPALNKKTEPYPPHGSRGSAEVPRGSVYSLSVVHTFSRNDGPFGVGPAMSVGYLSCTVQ